MSLNLPPRLSFFKERNYIPKSPKYEGITMPIEFAFRAGGKDFFRFTDTFSMPPIRSMKSVAFFEEARMKCSLEFLEEQGKARDAIWGKGVATLSAKDLNILYTLDQQLKERVAWVMPELGTLYKCASVTYFDDNENPSDYDFTYNHKKIESWKKEPIEDFFLSEPMKRLFPFLNVPKETFLTYSQVVEEMNGLQWEYLYSITSPKLT
jgi:hypothetical protein